jgi:hypothetical protein
MFRTQDQPAPSPDHRPGQENHQDQPGPQPDLMTADYTDKATLYPGTGPAPRLTESNHSSSESDAALIDEQAAAADRRSRKVRLVEIAVVIGSAAVVWGMQWLQEHYLDGIGDEDQDDGAG